MNARISDQPQALTAPDPAIIAAADACETLPQFVRTIFVGYRDRPALVDLATGLTTTYGQAWDRACAIASGLRDRFGITATDRVALVGDASTDYLIAELALTALGATIVPLAPDTPRPNLAHIITETAPRIALTASSALDSLREVADGDLPLVTIDAPAAGVTSVNDLTGSTGPVGIAAPSADDPALLLYTSGSTGAPKGAEYPPALVRTLWTARWLLDVDDAAITLIALPLNHYAGRAALFGTLYRGGTAYLPSAPNQANLLADLAATRPSALLMVPRLVELLHQSYAVELNGAPSTRDGVAEFGARVFGDRVRHVRAGSAPLSHHLREFLSTATGVPVRDLYGTTELGAVLIDGVPISGVQVELIDSAEQGYKVTDRPNPRGELVVRSPDMIARYYRRADATERAFDSDGFYHTGDIMEDVDGRYRYLDRRSSVVKLSNGEFVSPTSLELAYARSELIGQIYVHGDATMPYLVAVVVPAYDRAPDGVTQGQIGSELRRIAREQSFASAEVPRGVLIQRERFTVDNGLLSAVGKQVRPKLAERYGSTLADLAESLSDAPDATDSQVSAQTPPRTGVLALAASVLGIPSEELDAESNYLDLGGDSLSAVTLAHHIGRAYNVTIAANAIANASSTLGSVADAISAQLEGAGVALLASDVHPEADRLRADDLALSKFLPDELLAAAPELPVAEHISRVLITGANGFLGRFVLLEHLRRLVPEGGSVVAVVRASSDEAAADRLRAVFATSDELLGEFDRLSTGLTVIAADVAAPQFGLPDDQWDQLARTVDHVVHAAAFVNHALPYSELFGPNVVGTAEAIRLALTHCRKSVSFVSTMSVQWDCDPELFSEDCDIRVASAQRPVTDSYASGYASSKWASEVLLRNAADHADIPVRVFRSDMILAHTRFVGQVNATDVFTRLLLTMLLTGQAPRSFFATPGDRAPYEGLPVDFVAEAVTELGLQGDGVITYNVLNSRADSGDLDDFARWIADERHPGQNTLPYNAWFDETSAAVGAMPDHVAKNTLAPVLAAYAHPATHTDDREKSAGLAAAVSRGAISGASELPRLDAGYLAKYRADLLALGLLPRKFAAAHPSDRATDVITNK